ETILFQNAQGTGNTNFNGPISGTGSLVIAGNNSVYLNTTLNVYSGGTYLNAGTTIVQGSGNFGTGPINLIGGSFNSNAAQQVFSNTVNFNGAITFAGGQNAVFTGPTNLVGNAILNASNNALFSGVIAGTGTPVVIGGTVFFNNANTYTSGTIVAAGTL